MIGTTVSHYKILERLGGGGMGVVYKAQDTRLRRTVALKFLPPDLTRDEEAKTRFVHEAQAASALQHPNICTIHDIDQTDDHRLFIVMDCYEGQSLKQVIERGPLPIDEAIGIATQVAQGLAKAHENGIVHRDIKPANMMIGKDGIARIVDFGLAKLSGQTMVTKSGSMVGTAAYMSPEQARGEKVDHRTDIWSLGVVLYEMLTGHQPFASEYEQAMMYSILSGEPKPIEELRPEVPGNIIGIVQRAMEKDSKERYQTASELLADLESYKAGMQLSLQTRKVLSKKRKVAYAGLAALVLIIVISGIFKFTGRGEVFDRVAVLPFHNISKDLTQEYLADGMTEEVIARLQQIASLNVPSIRSSMKFKGSQSSYAEIARELGAKALVDASIQYVNNRVRVIARLVDPPTDRTLWTDTYDGSVEDILDLQSRIAQAVVREVRVKVSQDEQTRLSRSSRKVNPQAYELYLSARQGLFRLPSNPQRSLLDSSIAKLQRAITIEPDNALYYATLERGYSLAVGWFLKPSREFIPKMKAAAETALRLDPDLAESHLAAGHVDFFQFNFKSSLARTSRALELSPGNAWAYQGWATVLTVWGRFEEAQKMYQRMHEVDPVLFKELGGSQGFGLFMMHRYDDVISFFKEWMRDNPKSDMGLAFLAISYSMKGMHAEALAYIDSASHWGLFMKPVLLARAGKLALAMKIFVRDSSRIDSYSKACFFAARGERDAAIQWLQRAYDELNGTMYWLPHDPFLDNLRSDPRFKDILKKMNLLED